jgi:acetyl-CoA C-acetyltransferase
VDPRQPVLAGVAQSVRFPGEPLEAMVDVAAAALREAPLRPDVVAVVDPVSWPVDGRHLAERLRLSPREVIHSGMGGSSPQALVNRLSQQIAEGRLDCALIAGAEALASVMPYVKAGEQAPWTPAERPPGLADSDPPGNSELEAAAGLIAPIFFYPLIEHAVRRAARRSRADHLQHIAAMWSRFSHVAAENPYAWSPQARSTGEIATPTDGNRLVSDPYTKLLNANITVDMAAALVLCSAVAAEAAGIPRDQWVFVHAGAHANDHWNVSEREELHRSPALAACRPAIEGVELSHVDLYSCFPSAVQVAAYELGVEPSTVTGGLTFAGGPGNNYATHSIATMVARLREDPDAFGMTTAVSWYLTKHALGVYSARPGDFRLHEVDETMPRRELATEYTGPATVEAYTALFERDGSPGVGIVAARLPDGRRLLARLDHAEELVGSEDPLGAEVQIGPQGFRAARVSSG